VRAGHVGVRTRASVIPGASLPSGSSIGGPARGVEPDPCAFALPVGVPARRGSQERPGQRSRLRESEPVHVHLLR
jgi:hypothetical protein